MMLDLASVNFLQLELIHFPQFLSFFSLWWYTQPVAFSEAKLSIQIAEETTFIQELSQLQIMVCNA